MTTAATNGKVVAVDSQLSGNYIDSRPFKKWRRLQDNSILVIAGDASVLTPLGEFLDGERDKPPKREDFDFEAMHVKTDGVYLFDGNVESFRVGSRAAIGSGSPFAIGAMDYGASPKEAVEIARKRDEYTGGKIQVIELAP